MLHPNHFYIALILQMPVQQKYVDAKFARWSERRLDLALLWWIFDDGKDVSVDGRRYPIPKSLQITDFCSSMPVPVPYIFSVCSYW
jgi:hypothetical protein